MVFVDASFRTKAIAITGNALANTISGGTKNDSIFGAAGNDTFFPTANEGNDKIFDYETDNLLKILNVDGSNGSFKSSKYSGGDLTLTINGCGKIIFEDVAQTLNLTSTVRPTTSAVLNS